MADEIVISGISGRFPECDSLDEFKRKLYDSESPITYDERKWPKNYRYKFGKDDIPYGTGKFKNIDRYDNIVFAISPVLANQIDIINRMVLEPSFEAVFDAGINPYSLMGANVGCYFTSGISEVENIKLRTNVERLSLIGGSKGMLSNRVSFALNLTGPSITFYTAAYGGLEALSHAYENLITKRIDGAIVGSSASHVDPKLSINYQLMGYLSPDGTTKVFDADAKGFGRSDCVVILYLQRASDAKRSYGSLLFSETIFRGLSLKSFLGFDETFLEETLRAMYSKHKNVDPKDISFVEMDANAVKHIDQREALAVSKVFCNGRDSALLIGSVKSHSGHTETSAGYLSIIKACLALDSGVIAPNMYYTKPNPNIKPLVDGKLKVVAEPTALPGPIVAVNSFTLTGSISHAVIKQNPKKDGPDDNLPRLLILCGRMKDDLMGVIKKVESEPLNKEFVAITNDIFKSPIPSHIYRGYSVLSSTGGNTISDVEIIGGENRPVWFVFSGMGSQWNGMGKDLLRIPVFAQVIDECNTILRPKGIDIYNILTTDDPTIFDDIIHAFVGIVAVQIGLVKVMDTIGITPDGLIGHSLGETACAYADGSLTLEQAVLASYERGAVSNETETVKGMMAAVGIGFEEVKSMLPEEIEVACHNASDNCTLSGPAEQVTEFVAKLQKRNIFAKSVNVSNRAYHSRYVHPAAPLLLTRLNAIIPEPKERSSKWISTSVPEESWNESLVKTSSAAYFTNNFINPVLFEEGCRHIPEHAIILEIAPHGLLQAILKRSLPPTITKLSLTLRSERAGGVPHLLSTVGKLFIAGCQPDVNALYPKIEYPVSRGTPNTACVATWDHSRKWDVPGILTDTPLADEIFEVKLTRGCDYMFLKAHMIREHHIIPPSFYMYITWFIFSLLRREELGASNIVFEDVKIRKHLYVTIDKPRSLSVMIQGSGSFEVRLEGNEDNKEKTKVVMTGVIYVPYEKVNIAVDRSQTTKMKFEMNGQEFYQQLRSAGYLLQDCFNNLVREVKSNETECAGRILWNGNWICFLDTIMKINMYSQQASAGQLFFPKRIRKVTIGVSVFKTLKPGDEMIYKKDLVINKFCCDGLEVSNFIYGPEDLPFLSPEKKDIGIQGKRFISYSNPKIEDTDTFLNFCLELVCDSATRTSGSKLRVVDTTGNVGEILRRITEAHSYMKSCTVFPNVTELAAGKYAKDESYLVVVDSYSSLNKLPSQLKNKLDNMFILVTNRSTDGDSLIRDKNSYIEITGQNFNGTHFQLLKKLSTTNSPLPSVIIVDEHWPIKLASSLKSGRSEPVVLLRYSVELADLSHVLADQKQYSSIRFLFIMDEQPPKFSVKNTFYKNQVLRDLPISILRNGEWGTYWNVDAESSLELNHVQRQDFRTANVDVKYFTVDIEMISKDHHAKEKEYSFGLEFSGLSNAGTRIMGFAYYNQNEMKSKYYELDDQLVWSVPQDWSLEDAASVPLFYSQVYYILVLNAIKERSFKSVLVNSHNLSFVEAVLTVTSFQNLTVYVILTDITDAQILMKKFPDLSRSQFLDRNDCKYEIEIKSITKGEGVDIVINCLTDAQSISSAANCLKMLGKFVDLTDKQYKDEQQLGMYTFLKSIAYITAPHNVQSLLRLPSEQKKQLHDLIDNGIKNGLIRPVSRNTTRHIATTYDDRTSPSLSCNRGEEKGISNIKKIHTCSEKDLQTKKHTKTLKWDENRSYMIISGGKRTELWFDLLRWLLDRGVLKFLIALENVALDPRISRQINRFVTENNATIVLTPLRKAESLDDVSELIMQTNNIAPLGAVFFVQLDPAERIVSNFDTVCRNGPSCHFICLFSGALGECERRRQRGESTVFVYSKTDPDTLAPILQKLEPVLKESSTQLSPSFYELKEKSSRKRAIPLEIEIRDFISVGTQKLINIGYYATKQPEFIEISTRSQKLSEIKNLRPLFIIPAIDADSIRPLASTLLYPAFCATFSEQNEPPAMTAGKLFQKLQGVQPTGPVTIIGETWNSPIAIELALLVQAAERKVELFLIEGDPIMWKKCIERFGEICSRQFDDNFLQTILSSEEAKSEKAELGGSTWEENHDSRLKNLKCSQTDKYYVAKAVNGIRNRLINIAAYLPSKNFLNHAVLFKHRPSNRSLEQYCWSDDIYLFKEDKYESFLSNKKLLNIIHNDTLFSWFS